VKILVGLGNPGQTYRETRHNVGFRVIQLLAERRGVTMEHRLVSPADGRPACVYGEYAHDGQTLRLVMPLTMMNESGEALRALPAPAQNLLVICDDVNLPLGTIRLRSQGGAGGHHGLESCLSVVGTEQVARLRIGVGVTPLPRDLHEFVLSPFAREERPLIRQAIEQAADACEAWVSGGIEAAMNRYNTKAQDG
jgi:PTH1 family peptidyl-tRNA hydrolase